MNEEKVNKKLLIIMSIITVIVVGIVVFYVLESWNGISWIRI